MTCVYGGYSIDLLSESISYLHNPSSVAKALSSDMEGRRSEEKESLQQRYGDLKPRLSEANAHKVEQAMLELQVRWSELQDTLRRRRAGGCGVGHVGVYEARPKNIWL